MSIFKALLFILIFVMQDNANSQVSGIFQDFHSNKIENKDKPEREKLLISIASGYSLNSANSGKNNFMFSIDFIPRISNKIFLDFKLDLIKQGQSYNTLFNIIPEYKLNFAEDSEFSGYLEQDRHCFFTPKDILELTLQLPYREKLNMV